MPIISGSTVIRGSKGTPVLQDANDKLITVIQGSEDTAVKQKATGELLAELLGSEGVAIKQKATGELIAELVGSTGNPIAQDVNDKLISIIQGSQGSPIAQDASDRLVAMLYGSQGTPIAQDANDNLVAVMKGNYGGVLKTWKVDVDGRGEMFLTDPSDVWGVKRTMGLAEQSIRTHAPPLMFDRRGDIIYWDDFESTTQKYSSADGTCARVTTRAKTRDASLECVTGAALNNRAGPTYVISDFHTGTKMGAQVSFATANDVFGIDILVSYYDLVKVHTWSIRLKSDGTLQYGDLAGTWQDVPASSSIYKRNSYNFATLKMVFDISNDKYERAVVFNQEYDLSAYTCYSTALPASMPYLYVEFRIQTLEAVAKTAYFDNFFLTENEPDN